MLRLGRSGVRSLSRTNYYVSSPAHPVVRALGGAGRFSSGGPAEKVPAEASATIVDAVQPLYTATEGLNLGWNPTDMICAFIENLHLSWQIPYWEAIVLTTIGLRVCLLPLSIKTAQGSARMAKVRPLLQKVSDAMKRDPQASTVARRNAYAAQSKALLAQHKVNPLMSLAMPLVQLPVFMSFFFALQAMGGHFPGMESGGTLWFTDLTQPDSNLILPVMNAASFLVMVELGADGMGAGSNTQTFRWVMRGLALGMTPLTMNLPTGLFVYWTANNAISVSQATIMKLPAVKKALDIPDKPADEAQPDLKIARMNPFKVVVEGVKKEFAHSEKAKAEIVDGTTGRDTPSGPLPNAPQGPPPTTFSMPPRKAKKGKKGSK